VLTLALDSICSGSGLVHAVGVATAVSGLRLVMERCRATLEMIKGVAVMQEEWMDREEIGLVGDGMGDDGAVVVAVALPWAASTICALSLL
jgi:hypothetical protein